jgi:Viral BACON domain
LTATTGCAWVASSNAGFISITSGLSGSGSTIIAYNVNANGVSARSGTLTIAGQTFTVNQFGTGPTVNLDRTSLRYGATLSGALVTAQTSAQTIRLTQTSGPAVTWTATSNQSWLQVSPGSGSGGRELSITVNPAGLAMSGTATGVVTIALGGAGNTVGPINVTLVTMPTGTSVNPVGVIDTPVNNTTGVTGAIPVTGWALDDVDVANLFLCRAPVSGESAAADGRCGGLPQVFLGEAVFIEDARPDVQAAYPTRPRNYRGGWGFMVLTNMLPNQGNGPYTLFAHAVDREGHSLSLGSRNITCNNNFASTPFGTIDTPAQGETVSGAAYVNYAWALTQAGKVIPFNGSTITVFVDGAPVGTASYNYYRSDIAGYFPGLANTDGPAGFRVIDTTTLANGLHTIVWTVTDSGGATAGLGSRYFRVSNGTTAPVTLTDENLVSDAVALEVSPIIGRRGWEPDALWRAYPIGPSGRAVVRGEELDRFELQLGSSEGARYTGSLRFGGVLTALPIGSKLDSTTGVFTWSPGLGFVGTYDLVFVRWVGDRAVSQQNVRLILRPKSFGYVGTQAEIDSPRAQQDVAQPFNVVGWAADLDAAAGTGIDTLHAWAYPLTGGPPVFLGVPAYGGVRPDVAAVHGDQFRDTGFGLVVQGLPHGNYDLAVFPWSAVSGAFAPPKIVRVTVR